MKVTHLHLKDFRNHAGTRLTFGEGINALIGSNGAGKTNILEAISYVGLTKSFYASNDVTVLRVGEEGFTIEAGVTTRDGHERTVVVTFVRASRQKEIAVNRVPVETMASMIGQFPIVVLSPEHHAITAGGPADRRKFLDIIISQVHHSYLHDLLEYRRVLRQRNRVLYACARGQQVDLEVLEPWTAALAAVGGRLTARRKRVLREFGEYVLDAYGSLVSVKEVPELRYVASAGDDAGDEPDEIAAAMLSQMDERRSEEMRRGVSVVGPHRDELKLAINGLSVQQFASQGQHKTLLVALKLAEFIYMKDHAREEPVLLLDDLFSELDARRTERILGVAERFGQTFITATDETLFHGAISWNDRHRKFDVQNGQAHAS